MFRVGFIGVPGSGKTSTARGVASVCRSNNLTSSVELCSEYARRYISKYGPIEYIWEQFRLLKKQLDWEDSVGEVDLLLTDSPIVLNLLYAKLLSTGSKKDTMLVTDLLSEVTKLNYPKPRYDIIFHLPPVLTPVDDGIRGAEQFDSSWRNEADIQLMAIARFFNPVVLYEVASVEMSDRVSECVSAIESYINKH